MKSTCMSSPRIDAHLNDSSQAMLMIPLSISHLWKISFGSRVPSCLMKENLEVALGNPLSFLRTKDPLYK